jgi:hypothetical protein
VIVYLDDKRRQRAQIVSKIQHAVAGVPLLMIGMEKLSSGEELPIAIAEVALAAIVLATFVLELRAAIRHTKHGTAQSHPKVGWFDLAAGALLIYEATHGAHHKPFYLRAQFISGVVTIALGLLHHRLQHAFGKKRYFKIDDDGIEHKLMFRSWSIRWNQLKAVDLTSKEAVFERVDGERHKVNLGRLHNHEAVRRAVMDHPGAAKLLRG